MELAGFEETNRMKFTANVGGLGVGGNGSSEELDRSQPLPKRDGANNALVGLMWRQKMPKTQPERSMAEELSKLESMKETGNEPDLDESENDKPSEPDSSDDNDESEEERVKKKKKLKEKTKEPPDPKELLRMSRKAALNPELYADLTMTTVKLNPEMSNYQPWLVSRQEITLSQGWSEHIMDIKAKTWIETPYESAFDVKSLEEVNKIKNEIIFKITTLKEKLDKPDITQSSMSKLGGNVKEKSNANDEDQKTGKPKDGRGSATYTMLSEEEKKIMLLTYRELFIYLFIY